MRSGFVALLALTGIGSMAFTPALGEIAPVSGEVMRGPLIDDETGDLGGELEDAHSLVMGMGQGALDAALTSAEDGVDLILSPKAPSLSDPDAGTVDLSIQPATLEEYAEACRDLALEAHELVLIDKDAHVEAIGTNLRTIQALLPGYRAAAGLN